MKEPAASSGVLTVRIGSDLESSLAREARRRRKSKSELVREILAAGLGGEGGVPDLAQEARRQSTLVSRRRSDKEMLDFLEHAADTRGWE
jgi:hypothetical protein